MRSNVLTDIAKNPEANITHEVYDMDQPGAIVIAALAI
jgi:hypothetical protein